MFAIFPLDFGAVPAVWYFFIIIIFILFTMSVPDVVRSKLEIYTVLLAK
jgi:hypothetical protein